MELLIVASSDRLIFFVCVSRSEHEAVTAFALDGMSVGTQNTRIIVRGEG